VTYLNFYGLIPTVSRIGPDQLEGLEGSKMLGQRAGTLLITEFADFECPACAVEDEAMDRLFGTFPGRIQYNFRHLPLVKLHQHARAAALASECAAIEGRFWETKHLFFANQRQIPALLSEPAPLTIPPELAGQYSRCVASSAAWGEVEKDLEQAKRLGLHGTPTIVIGDKLVHGMLTYPRLALVVRDELKARHLLETHQASARPEPGCGSPRETTGCTLE
jgi:protein-disulfide isomerase